MACPLLMDKVWLDKYKYDDAEKQYYERLAKLHFQSDKMSPKTKSSVPSVQPKPVNLDNTKNKNPASSAKDCTIPIDNSKPTQNSKSRKNKKKRNQNSSLVENSEPVQTKQPSSQTTSQSPATTPNICTKIDSQITVTSKEVKETCNRIDKSNLKHCYDFNLEGSQCSLAGEVAKARQHIKNSLECMDGIAAMASAPNTEVLGRLTNIEKENIALRTEVSELRKLVDGLLSQVSSMRISEPFVAVCPAKPATPAAPAKDDDDDVDLFGSDSEEESEAIAKLKEERLAAYNAKKSKKPTLIAKSNIILDVKPWDDETDMKEMEKQVRAISTDGLLWGAAKLVPLAYGIHKLQISCVVEDDKVSIDWLQEELEKIEDYVQSVDIAAFNKV